MIEDKPLLDKITYEFLQETNTNGSTGKSNEDELLTITYEGVCDSLDEESGFYVIRTTGWSVNDSSEILGLFKQIKNVKHEKD
jgi:hypothetical protein